MRKDRPSQRGAVASRQGCVAKCCRAYMGLLSCVGVAFLINSPPSSRSPPGGSLVGVPWELEDLLFFTKTRP